MASEPLQAGLARVLGVSGRIGTLIRNFTGRAE